MKRLVLAAAMVISAPVYAQQAQINVGPGGFQMNFQAPDGHHGHFNERDRDRDRDEPFRVSYEQSRSRKTVFKIVGPDGVRAEVYDGKKRVARDRIPFSFEAKANKNYRVVIDLPHGEKFDEKITTRKNLDTVLWVSADRRRNWNDRDRNDRRYEKTAVIENSVEGFRLEFRTHPERRTEFKLLSPAGLQAQVFDGRRVVTSGAIPLKFDAVPDRSYRFVITATDGSVWDKNFTARRGEEASLFVYPPSASVVHVPPPHPTHPPVVHVPPPHPAHPPVVHIPPPHPAQPIGPVAMTTRDFRALLHAIAEETFPNDKMNVLTTAAPSAWFTIDQVGELVDAFTFPGDKVNVVRVTRDRILDRQNAFKLYSHFTFPGDKEQVKRMFQQ